MATAWQFEMAKTCDICGTWGHQGVRGECPAYEINQQQEARPRKVMLSLVFNIPQPYIDREVKRILELK